MMLRIRLLLAWLLLAALPLQGLAAASMLFCGSAGQHAPVEAAAHSGSMRHGSAAEAAAAHAQHPAADAHDHATAPDSGEHALAHGDGGHKCSVCVAFCQGAAITGFCAPAPLVPAPHAMLAEPPPLIHSHTASVPEKPPRG